MVVCVYAYSFISLLFVMNYLNIIMMRECAFTPKRPNLMVWTQFERDRTACIYFTAHSNNIGRHHMRHWFLCRARQLDGKKSPLGQETTRLAFAISKAYTLIYFHVSKNIFLMSGFILKQHIAPKYIKTNKESCSCKPYDINISLRSLQISQWVEVRFATFT